MCNSLNCCSVTSDGDDIRLSWPLALVGKAWISLKLSTSFNNIIILSIPGAMPPCGGTPYLNALYKDENLF